MNQLARDADDVEIDIMELIALIGHWLWLILGCGIVAALAAFGISYFFITPMYESTTRVYILNSDENSSLTYSDTQLATQLTKDYEELITSRYVLEQVINQFGLDETYGSFKDKITIDNTNDTRIIDITVKNENPSMAQRLANAIRDIAAEKIKSVMDIEAVNVVDEANLSESPCEPSVVRWTAVGFLVGAVLCTAIVVIRFLLDDTIKSSEDVEKYLELSTLALIPDAELAEHTHKKSHAARQGTAKALAKTHTSSNRQTVSGDTEEVVDLELK